MPDPSNRRAAGHGRQSQGCPTTGLEHDHMTASNENEIVSQKRDIKDKMAPFGIFGGPPTSHESSRPARSKRNMAAFNTERVLSVHHWNDTLFSFTTTRDASLRFHNGHFVMIGLEVDGKPLMRAYSIAS